MFLWETLIDWIKGWYLLFKSIGKLPICLDKFGHCFGHVFKFYLLNTEKLSVLVFYWSIGDKFDFIQVLSYPEPIEGYATDFLIYLK